MLQLFNFYIYIKCSSFGIKYIILSLIKSLKEVKLKNTIYQINLEKIIDFLNLLNTFISLGIKTKFEPKDLCKSFLHSIKSVDLNKKFSKDKEKSKSVSNSVIDFLQSIRITNILKNLLFDEMSISLGFPKYENGWAFTAKFLELDKLLNNMIFNKLK